MRYPYHRYLRYLIIEGDSAEEIEEHLYDLKYIPPRTEDVEELIKSIRGAGIDDADLRAAHGVDVFDEVSPSLDMAFRIVEEIPLRVCSERLLLDKVPHATVATILKHRFHKEVTEKSVDIFRACFWDTFTLSPVDFANYFTLGNKLKPHPPEGSIEERPLVRAWEEGVHPDEENLPIDKMIRSVAVDSFMKFKKAKDAKDARDWASTMFKAASASKSFIPKSGDGGPKDDPVVLMIKYPEDSAPSLSDLHKQHVQTNMGSDAGKVVEEIDAS